MIRKAFVMSVNEGKFFEGISIYIDIWNDHRNFQQLKLANSFHNRHCRRRGGIRKAAFAHLGRVGTGAQAAWRLKLLYFSAPWCVLVTRACFPSFALFWIHDSVFFLLFPVAFRLRLWSQALDSSSVTLKSRTKRDGRRLLKRRCNQDVTFNLSLS
jgi:hypothetical protein